MPILFVTDSGGAETAVKGQSDQSVMEVVREHGFDDLLALCGGCCSCATCHVYVDEAFANRLPPMTDDENDLLDSADNRRSNSRLSCQLPFDAALDGLRITIAPA